MSGFLESAGAGSVAWLMVLFLGVAYWAFRPGRRPSGRRNGTAADPGNDGT